MLQVTTRHTATPADRADRDGGEGSGDQHHLSLRQQTPSQPPICLRPGSNSKRMGKAVRKLSRLTGPADVVVHVSGILIEG